MIDIKNSIKFMKFSFESLKFFRGVGEDILVDRPTIHKTRMDRRPRDLALGLHEEADNWFNMRFGVRYRSQALFITGSWTAARAYAASDQHVVRIIPAEQYRFCWSATLRDLLEYHTTANANESISNFLERNLYSEDDLKAANVSGHEVMLHCSEYIAIPYPRPPDQIGKSSLILLG
ncbi:hypothetical protein [Duganella sp. Leaf61]|uniref:hypothetical protein n=1 Tax=Duganella sp. Leaf61 TaxID=1736227 RepID=UPI0012E1F8E1|nr:hypothetical protein [Duganella sp. Leaf61]